MPVCTFISFYFFQSARSPTTDVVAICQFEASFPFWESILCPGPRAARLTGSVAWLVGHSWLDFEHCRSEVMKQKTQRVH